MTETEKLLRAALFALNSISNNGLKHPDFKDSYSLAKAIDEHLKSLSVTRNGRDTTTDSGGAV